MPNPNLPPSATVAHMELDPCPRCGHSNVGVVGLDHIDAGREGGSGTHSLPHLTAELPLIAAAGALGLYVAWALFGANSAIFGAALAVPLGVIAWRLRRIRQYRRWTARRVEPATWTDVACSLCGWSSTYVVPAGGPRESF